MPVNTESQIQDSEELTSSRAPKAPERDKAPERNYPAAERQSNNRTDAAAPSGPVNIPVRGGEKG